MVNRPRLLYGFLSSSADPINISIPWQTSVADGAFKMNYNLVDAIRDNLICWANTNWGERPYRFKYGLDARRYLFMPVSLSKQNILENAREQLAKYFSFLQIDNLDVLTAEDEPSLSENSIIFVLEAHPTTDPTKIVKIFETITA